MNVLWKMCAGFLRVHDLHPGDNIAALQKGQQTLKHKHTTHYVAEYIAGY